MGLNVVRLGKMDYEAAFELQKQVQRLRIDKQIEDTVLFVEHPAVLTMGTRGDQANLKLSKEALAAKGVSIVEVNRGGDVTYHGPGQLVVYPIMDLNHYDRDIRRFIQKLQQIIIDCLKTHFQIEADGEQGTYTGVFVGGDKIAAIGLAVEHSVTMHGFAFNLNTDLSHFDWIVPCGLKDRGVTSIKALTGKPCDFSVVEAAMIDGFETHFHVKTQPILISQILGEEGV